MPLIAVVLTDTVSLLILNLGGRVKLLPILVGGWSIRVKNVLAFLVACCCLMSEPSFAAAADFQRPNFLFILADDLGWGDVDFHGGPVPTPHLDRLRRMGIEFTRHYTHPVCTPTRAALLSGRYCSRFGVTTPANPRTFPWETLTLPRALAAAGYETALIGKWHLGSRPDWGPNHFGFESSYGSLAGGVGPWNHQYEVGPFSQTWHRNGQLFSEEGHVTDLLTAEAVRWLQNQPQGRPFFLYLPFTAVHIPLREPEKYLQRVPEKFQAPAHRQYLASILHLDDSIGQVLAALESVGRLDETLIVFSSDNGGTNAENNSSQYAPDNYPPGKVGGSNLPLRGAKGDVYEGGIRTPTLVCWPEKLHPGKFETPVHISDWMPTFCRLAGAKFASDPQWDGIDLWPALSGMQPLPQREIYVVGRHFRNAAIQSGDWKLVASQPQADNPAHPYGKLELYHLSEDLSETDDLSESDPERVAMLEAALIALSQRDRDAVAGDDK